MKKILRATVLILSLSFVLISAVQAQSPQQTLNQYIANLPEDPQRLRPAGEDYQARADDEAGAGHTESVNAFMKQRCSGEQGKARKTLNGFQGCRCGI